MKKYCKALILNDTSYEGHVGSMLVMSVIRSIVSDVSKSCKSLSIVDVRKSFSVDEFKSFDLVVLNGEGTFHNDSKAGIIWFKVLSELSKQEGRRKFVLLNSAWFENIRLNEMLPIFDVAVFRDFQSLNNASRYLEVEPIICPDFAFFGALNLDPVSDNGALDKNVNAEQFGVNGSGLFNVKNDIKLSIFVGSNRLKTFFHQLNRKDLVSIKRIKDKFNEHFLHVRFKTLSDYISSMACLDTLYTARFHGVVIGIAKNIDIAWSSSNTPKIEANAYLFSELAGVEVTPNSWLHLQEEDYDRMLKNADMLLKNVVNDI